MEEFIRGLPKVELHLHIEGALEPELIFALAERNGMTLDFPDVAALKSAYAFSDLQSFLDLYYSNMQVLLTEEDFFDLTLSYFARVARDNVIHCELFFDPQAHLARGVPIATQLAGIERGCQEALERFGITSHVILSFLRDMSEESALETLEVALAHRHRFIGVGLDSAERDHPPEKFARAFAKARQEGLRLVAHAGEEGPHHYISTALDELGVERIDHGVRCVESPALMSLLAERGTPLTVCPLSNLYLKVFGQMSEHSLPRMLEAGIKVTLNSDDPAYFGGYMNDNFLAVQEAFGFGRDTWIELSRNAIEASFAEPTRKREMHDALSRYVG